MATPSACGYSFTVMTSLLSLRARELSALLRELAPSQPILIWSRAGAGKTALVRAYAASTDLEVVPVGSADLEPPRAPAERSALGGFQAPRMTARPRPVLVHVTGAEDEEASPGLEALVDVRHLGRYRLPEDSPLVAEARLGPELVPTTPPGVASRFLQVVLEPDLEDWIPWAEAEGLAQEVLDYLRRHPERLEAPGDEGGPASSPRSWEAAGRALGAQGLTRRSREAVLRGLLASTDAQALVEASLTVSRSGPTVAGEIGGTHGRRRPARAARQ